MSSRNARLAIIALAACGALLCAASAATGAPLRTSATAKGLYMKSVTISTTHGPGIKIDTTIFSAQAAVDK